MRTLHDHAIDVITSKLRGDDLTPAQRAERAEHSILNDAPYLRSRLAKLDVGAYVLWKPTACVLSVAAEALASGEFDVFTDDPYIKIRRGECHVDHGDALGLPLVKLGPGGDFNREVKP